jgi:hypothetical protein
MKPEPDQECVLCGTMSPCRKTDAGNAQFFECANRDCGPVEIFLGAGKRLYGTRTMLHLMLSKEAQKVRKANMVLRIRVDPATNGLRREAVRRDEVK